MVGPLMSETNMRMFGSARFVRAPHELRIVAVLAGAVSDRELPGGLAAELQWPFQAADPLPRKESIPKAAQGHLCFGQEIASTGIG